MLRCKGSNGIVEFEVGFQRGVCGVDVAKTLLQNLENLVDHLLKFDSGRLAGFASLSEAGFEVRHLLVHNCPEPLKHSFSNDLIDGDEADRRGLIWVVL